MSSKFTDAHSQLEESQGELDSSLGSSVTIDEEEEYRYEVPPAVRKSFIFLMSATMCCLISAVLLLALCTRIQLLVENNSYRARIALVYACVASTLSLATLVSVCSKRGWLLHVCLLLAVLVTAGGVTSVFEINNSVSRLDGFSFAMQCACNTTETCEVASACCQYFNIDGSCVCRRGAGTQPLKAQVGVCGDLQVVLDLSRVAFYVAIVSSAAVGLLVCFWCCKNHIVRYWQNETTNRLQVNTDKHVIPLPG